VQQLEGHLKQVLNHATANDLMAQYGISGHLAVKIIAHRPYQSEADVLEKAAIPKRAFERLLRHLQPFDERL
jgi:DNA uptake protein ComE-like DNA-binding protein